MTSASVYEEFGTATSVSALFATAPGVSFYRDSGVPYPRGWDESLEGSVTATFVLSRLITDQVGGYDASVTPDLGAATAVFVLLRQSIQYGENKD